MKRLRSLLAFVIGTIALVLLLPLFDAPLPREVKITRDQARGIADAEARKLGIRLDVAWPVTVWEDAPIIEQELESRPDQLRDAKTDPVVGPRLGGWRTTYFHKTREKFPDMGFVIVGADGRVHGARRRLRNEAAAPSPAPEALKPLADAFVKSRVFPGAPNPTYEGVRPNVLRNRTDYVFRYRVQSAVAEKISYYLGVYFNGDQFAGWVLLEEYADGSQYQPGSASDIANLFGTFALLLVLLLALLMIFLKKYHAGEVGVGTAALLFALSALVLLVGAVLTFREDSFGVGFGGISAFFTALAFSSFRFIFFSVSTVVLIALSWSVGESYARERWGERLASFDAILRRDPINASVGRSLLDGLLFSPLVAAATLALGAIPLGLRIAHAVVPEGTAQILNTTGGALTLLAASWTDATVISVVALLFLLGAFNKKRLLPVGIVVAIVVGTLFLTMGHPPIRPLTWELVFGFGAPLAAVFAFFAFDLLAAATALFFGLLLMNFLPFFTFASGAAATAPMIALATPTLLTLGVAVAGLFTRRYVVYRYEDLAPHVRRIVERERVKAEIDAANRIQAALLPCTDPVLHGASVSSHYRAASEIGGDYFDFLELPDERIGVAFGDVSGHGLTSGIVMAMAKSALLVQVDHDHSPTTVLNVLNDTVMKTAPKRMLMTFFFGVLDPVEQRLRFSSAGHHDPYVYRAKTKTIESLSSWGFPLGVRRREPFREHIVEFSAGDRLILYSDGLIEALDDDGEPYGFERFERMLSELGTKSAEEIKRGVLNAVKKFTRNRPPEDDQTLVVISFDEAGAAQKSA